MKITDYRKHSRFLWYLSWGLFLELSLLSLPVLAQSQWNAKNSIADAAIAFEENFDPPGDGEPQDTVGAGSRDGGRCLPDEKPMRAIMPDRNYGLTLQERPSIFVDLPETSAREVVLSFKDEAGDEYQRIFLPIPSERGIVSFALARSQTPLSPGKNYQWSLTFVCGESVQPDDPVFLGWVQRVARSHELDGELAQLSDLERAQWYGARGYWYDLIAVMEGIRRSQPRDEAVEALWEDLLASVGLDAIVEDRH
ncbi:MAG: DUF928 domain-containing protein [Cyanobacteriota bacterium]|nr:DUF928 domain-containing protein [Cyanobacteriota bacterium]